MTDFHPHFLAQDPWLQTVLGRYWPHSLPKVSEGNLLKVSLRDGDHVLLHENIPREESSYSEVRVKRRWIVLVHGMAGCATSSYMMRLASLFLHEGYPVVRVNLRNAGSGFGLSRNLYHAGRSDDLRDVFLYLSQRHAEAEFTAIGISLGGNILLKLAGEEGGCF